MTRIHEEIRINIPIEVVFDYVTTPGNWPAWHRSSLGVSSATDHLLELGEQYRVAGRRVTFDWYVRVTNPAPDLPGYLAGRVYRHSHDSFMEAGERGLSSYCAGR